MSSPADSIATVPLPAEFLAELWRLPPVPETGDVLNLPNLVDHAGAFVKQVARMGKQQMKTAQEVTLLSAEVQGLADELRRAIAGKEEVIENLRRERDGLLQKNELLLGELLSVTDLFEHALHFARAAGDRRWMEELSRVDKGMLQVLLGLGLREIPALGTHFDPVLHEVVDTRPRDQCRAMGAKVQIHDIVEVARRGFFVGAGPTPAIARRAQVITAAE